ncbi:MAG TPA: DUF3135 domain-containing protein [Burkholderiales bacterium]|nr:DUF3135 domain-containing protein [Burkholderiales bacterium]
MEFDFQKWATLAREDGAEFERQRRAAIDQLIGTASPAQQQRLRGLQFRIDLERSRSTTPLGACVRMNSLMWASFARLRDELNGLNGTKSARSARAAPAGPAEVVPFRRPGTGREEPPAGR